jgi:hypothetical protein
VNPEAVFTDRDLGKKFPEILRGAGLEVERHARQGFATVPLQTATIVRNPICRDRTS